MARKRRSRPAQDRFAQLADSQLEINGETVRMKDYRSPQGMRMVLKALEPLGSVPDALQDRGDLGAAFRAQAKGSH